MFAQHINTILQVLGKTLHCLIIFNEICFHFQKLLKVRIFPKFWPEIYKCNTYALVEGSGSPRSYEVIKNLDVISVMETWAFYQFDKILENLFIFRRLFKWRLVKTLGVPQTHKYSWKTLRSLASQFCAIRLKIKLWSLRENLLDLLKKISVGKLI